MIKFVVAAIWISLATTGAILYSFETAQSSASSKEPADADAFQGLDYVRTPIISVPLFDRGTVHGYFLARLVYTAEATRLAELKLPADSLFSDIIYSHLYAHPDIDFSKRESLDADAFRENIRTAMNERLGEEFIREVIIEQIDYLPKSGVGQTRIAGNASETPLPTPSASSGH